MLTNSLPATALLYSGSSSQEPQMCLKTQPLIDTNSIVIVSKHIEDDRRAVLLKQFQDQGSSNCRRISSPARLRGRQYIPQDGYMKFRRYYMCSSGSHKFCSFVYAKISVLCEEVCGERHFGSAGIQLLQCGHV